MNLSERNKKVAIARWKKIHNKEKSNISHDKNSIIKKSTLCGFLAGDGSVQIRKEKNFYHYQLDFFPDDEIMLNEYLRLIKEVYKKSPLVKRKEKFFCVRLTSKTIVKDITNLCEFGMYKWNLPVKLFSNDGAKEAWLRAFFSAEAYVNSKAIKIQTVNKKSMKFISNLLKEMNIENNYYEYDSKKKNHSNVSIIIISKKEARKEFYNKIGFHHKTKTNKLKESLSL